MLLLIYYNNQAVLQKKKQNKQTTTTTTKRLLKSRITTYQTLFSLFVPISWCVYYSIKYQFSL